MDRQPLDTPTLHTLLEHAPVAIVFLGPDLAFRYVNKLDPPLTWADVIGRHYSTFGTPEQNARLHQAYELAKQTGQAQHVESLADFPDGTRHSYLTTTSALWDDDGEFAGWVNIATEISAQKQAEAALQKARAELAEVSRRAGMAEIASGILHNVGNVLNSINVSAAALLEQVDSSHGDTLKRLVALCEEKADTLPDFLAHDPRGRKLLELLSRLVSQLAAERAALRAEIARLLEHIDMIRSTIAAQQAVASAHASLEDTDLIELIHRALAVFRFDLDQRRVLISVEIDGPARARIDRRATLQSVVALVRDTIDALSGANGPHMFTLRACPAAESLRFELRPR